MSDGQQPLRASFTDQERQAMLGRLLRAIAHDLNNHLTVVSSFIQLVEDTMPSVEDFAADIEDATVSIDSASELAGLLLTLSKSSDDDDRYTCDLDETNEQMKPLIAVALGRSCKLIWYVDALTGVELGISQRCWIDLCLELAHVARQHQCAKMTVWLERTGGEDGFVQIHMRLEGPSLLTPLDELATLARVKEVLHVNGGELERELDASGGTGHHLVIKLPIA